MADTIADDAFAKHVHEIGNATFEQIDAARAEQAELKRKGVSASLGDVLVQQGVLTPTIRENIERKLRTRQEGGLSQLGGYTLLRKLGEGGMGAVFLAEDKNKQKFAMKILAQRLNDDPEFLRRFQREAKAALRLKHENIVSAVAVGEDLNTHFYVMEYCDGQPLDKLLKRERLLEANQALKIVIEVARGLKHAHDNKIIHRDIKPANIFMASSGQTTLGSAADLGVARILDLGLSKHIGDSEQSFATQTGVIMGTPHYISPEQANSDKNIDGRTDIYSLGATFYHLVTGETPFNADTSPMIIMKHLTAQLPNPQDLRPEIPDAVARVIQLMMARHPDDRYSDCGELLADLDHVAKGEMPRRTISEERSSILARKNTTTLGDMTQQGFKRGATPGGETIELQPARSNTVRNALIAGVAVATLGFAGFVILAFGQSPAASKQPLVADKPIEKKDVAPEKKDPPLSKPPQPAPIAEPSAENALELAPGVKLEFVLAKAGEFEMGSDRFGGSGPAHRVRITRPFYIGKFEITVAQMRAFCDEAKFKTEAEQLPQTSGINKGKWERYQPYNWRNPGYKQDDTHPAVAITLNDAHEFCRWLSQKSGKTVRLPTEAEWEYAARGPNGLIFPWGELWEANSANVADKSLKDTGFEMKFGGTPDDDGVPYTAPVGFFKKTKTWCGAYDLHGNVWEWVEDYFAPYTSEMLIDPKGPPKSESFIIRGGSWNANHPEANAVRRVARPASDKSVALGFRVAMDALPPK
jgi:serine/threonine protein kinase/formylglycine-generating enzyme required for sulfatase activity